MEPFRKNKFKKRLQYLNPKKTNVTFREDVGFCFESRSIFVARCSFVWTSIFFVDGEFIMDVKFCLIIEFCADVTFSVDIEFYMDVTFSEDIRFSMDVEFCEDIKFSEVVEFSEDVQFCDDVEFRWDVTKLQARKFVIMVLCVEAVRANSFCASLLRTQIHTPRHASSAR